LEALARLASWQGIALPQQQHAWRCHSARITESEFEALAEAICEHLSDKTGFCVEGLSIGFDVTYLPERMDCEENEDED